MLPIRLSFLFGYVVCCTCEAQDAKQRLNCDQFQSGQPERTQVERLLACAGCPQIWGLLLDYLMSRL